MGSFLDRNATRPGHTIRQNRNHEIPPRELMMMFIFSMLCVATQGMQIPGGFTERETVYLTGESLPSLNGPHSVHDNDVHVDVGTKGIVVGPSSAEHGYKLDVIWATGGLCHMDPPAVSRTDPKLLKLPGGYTVGDTVYSLFTADNTANVPPGGGSGHVYVGLRGTVVGPGNRHNELHVE